MPRDAVNVLVTCGGGPGILAQVQSLAGSARYRARVVLADVNPASGNMFLPEVDARYQIPACDTDAFIPALLRLIDREKIDYLYSGLDEEMPVIARHRAALAEHGCRVLLPPAAALDRALDKRATQEALAGKVTMPRTFYLDAGFDADAIYEALDGAVLFKVNASRGGRHIYIPEDRDEYDFVARRVRRLMREQDLAFMAQAFVTGDEYNVTALHDLAGRQIYAVSRRKFERRKIKSTTTAAVIHHRADVIDQAVTALRALDLARGFSNVEMIVSDRDDKPYFIEVNGGRTAAQDMNLVASGINLTDLMIDILRGEPVAERPHPKDGIATLKIRRDVIVDYADIAAMPVP